MPVAKLRRSEASSSFSFINVTHPDEFRQKATQKTIRSGAMAAIGCARRRKPANPVIVELHMPHTGSADSRYAEHDLGAVVPAIIQLHSVLQTVQSVPPTLPHIGVFAIEPDQRQRELLHFST